MHPDIAQYHQAQTPEYQNICNQLHQWIQEGLHDAESKVWHGHPVWFLNGNPIVGYSHQKKGIRLMFWSGADFEPSSLEVRKGKFKDASIFYRTEEEIDPLEIQSWLAQSRLIQWDYKNIVKRKGKLVRL
jgi:hypothetical protein